MTRSEQLLFCKRCRNRSMDMDRGLICSLTGTLADFTESCENFNLDEKAQAEMAESPEYRASELSASISSEKLMRLREEQNLGLGIFGASLVGLIGAILWAVITVSTGWQIAFMPLAIGGAVGYTLRYLGKGIDQIFGISGAMIAVISCVLGNFLGILGFIAEQEGLPYFETLLYFDYSYTFVLMAETFKLIDFLFYGIAGFEGYKFAFRQFNLAEIATLK